MKAELSDGQGMGKGERGLHKQLLARYSFDPGHGSKCPIYLSRVVYAFFGVAFSYVPTFIGVYIIQTSST